jgi:hypothetical protein
MTEWKGQHLIESFLVQAKLTAVNVPGKKSMVKAAIVFIAILSRFVSSAIVTCVLLFD